MVVRVLKKATLTEDRRYSHVKLIEESVSNIGLLLCQCDETFWPEKTTITVMPDEFIEVWSEGA